MLGKQEKHTWTQQVMTNFHRRCEDPSWSIMSKLGKMTIVSQEQTRDRNRPFDVDVYLNKALFRNRTGVMAHLVHFFLHPKGSAKAHGCYHPEHPGATGRCCSWWAPEKKPMESIPLNVLWPCWVNDKWHDAAQLAFLDGLPRNCCQGFPDAVRLLCCCQQCVLAPTPQGHLLKFGVCKLWMRMNGRMCCIRMDAVSEWLCVLCTHTFCLVDQINQHRKEPTRNILIQQSWSDLCFPQTCNRHDG